MRRSRGALALLLALGIVAVPAAAQRWKDASGTWKAAGLSATGSDAGPLPVQGGTADGSTTAGHPVLVGGTDGTNAQTLLLDTSGRPTWVGKGAMGVTASSSSVGVAFEGDAAAGRSV